MSRSLLLVALAAVICVALGELQSMSLSRHKPGVLAPVSQLIERHAIARNIDPKIALMAAGVTDLNMVGNVFPVGVYGIDIEIGTPRKTFKVAVDSGSCTLIVPGSPCKGCTSDIAYRSSESSTSKIVPCPSLDFGCFTCSGSNCTYSNSYQTCVMTNPNEVCTVSGQIYMDHFSLGGLSGTTSVGTITYQTSNFVQFKVIDGVIGFACDSQYNRPTPLQDLVNQGKIQDMFSMCFDESGQGGVFTLGGADPKLYTGEFQYTPFLGDGTGLYSVNLNDVVVGKTSIGVPSYVYNNPMYDGTVIDSGTNIFLLPGTAFSALKKTFRDQCSTNDLFGVCGQNATNTIFDNQLCFPMTLAQRQAYPDITLTFDPNVKVTMTYAEYIIEFVPGSGKYCLGVINTGANGFTIIGDTNMSRYVSLYDRVNNRLGFAPVNAANCKGSSL